MIAWPREARRRQLVITNGWSRGDHYAWLIAEGTKVVSVYHLRTGADLDSLLTRAGRGLVGASMGSPLDKASWSIAGVIVVPDPPPPPEPGGFPLWYVQRVMDTAWSLDTHVDQPQIQPVQTGP